jgi:hypothetical protein
VLSSPYTDFAPNRLPQKALGRTSRPAPTFSREDYSLVTCSDTYTIDDVLWFIFLIISASLFGYKLPGFSIYSTLYKVYPWTRDSVHRIPDPVAHGTAGGKARGEIFVNRICAVQRLFILPFAAKINNSQLLGRRYSHHRKGFGATMKVRYSWQAVGAGSEAMRLPQGTGKVGA